MSLSDAWDAAQSLPWGTRTFRKLPKRPDCLLTARFLIIPLQGVNTGWQSPAPSALLISRVPITSQKRLNRLQLQGHFFHQDIFPSLK